MEAMVDDDFGDIYADVEVQASSAINSISNFTKSHTQESLEEEALTPTANECNVDPNIEQLNSKWEKWCDSDTDGSDSEDDLTIVLNDEDCKGFIVATERNSNEENVEEEEEEKDGKNGLNPSACAPGVKTSYPLQYPQYKHVKPCGSSFPSNNKGNESVGVVSCSSKSARGDQERNRCKQHNISNTSHVANICIASNSVASHGGYSFSLPWYRTILDVNIDAFEEKRWRFPGVDLSDFFNFGFNEESWKQYCISLEQFRQRSHLHSRFQNHESSKLTQACEVGLECNRGAQHSIAEDIAQAGFSSKSADILDRQVGWPKGRAIQVEDSTGERKPTMDLRRPRAWDSDVVIQINVHDCRKNSTSSGEGGFHHIDYDGHEAATSRDFLVDERKDDHYSRSADDHYSRSADAEESPTTSIGNVKSSSTNRCSQSMLDSSQMLLDPDNNHAKDQSSDLDRYHHKKMNAETSDDVAEEIEAVEMVEVENGRNTCKSNQCLTETEMSGGDQSHFSLTLSCSGSDSDASEDGVCSISEVSCSPLRRQASGTILHESVASDRKSLKSSDTKMKLDNSQHYSKNRRPFCDGMRHKNRRLHRVPEGRIHTDTDSDAFPVSRDKLSIDSHKHMEKMRDFGYHYGEEFSYDRKRDLYCCCGSDRSANKHVQDVRIKHPHRKYRKGCGDYLKPQERRNWSEDHLHERNFRLDNRVDIDKDWDRGDIGKDWDCGRRGLSPEGMIPLTYRESRKSVSKHNNFKETDIEWRRKGDKFQYGKKKTWDSCSRDLKNEDDLMLQRYSRSTSVINQKRGFAYEKYTSNIPFIGRESNPCGRTKYGSNLGNSWCMETVDEHWDSDRQRLSFWSHRVSHADDEERWEERMSSRISILDSRVAERYRRRRREISDDQCRDSHLVDSFNDIDYAEDGMIYTDDQVPQSRKYHQRSRVLHQMQGESVLRHPNDEFHAERSSCSYEKPTRFETIHAKCRSAEGWMVVDDMQLEWHRYKIFKGESSSGFHKRNPNMMNRGEQKKISRRCCDPVDLIFEEGKSSGRCSDAESLMSNSKFEKRDPKFAKERKNSKDFNETQSGKAISTGISKIDSCQGDEKWLDKFPVTEHHQDLDIEEGQIIPEEQIVQDRLEKKQASGIAAPLCTIKKKVCQSQRVSSGNETKGYDDQRILDLIAKMERRRERFKDPVAYKSEPDKTQKPQVDLVADIPETKIERPARKRRWGGS